MRVCVCVRVCMCTCACACVCVMCGLYVCVGTIICSYKCTYVQSFGILLQFCAPQLIIHCSVCSAVVWGTSVKYNPQRVGKDHELNDEDVVQVVKRWESDGFSLLQL